MKKLLSVVLSIVMIFALAACGGGEGGNASVTDGVSENANITILDYAEMSTLNPIDIGTESDQVPVFMLYDPLVKLGADQEYIWMLAKDCDMSDDGLEYTFHLREGISFSDGTPWNADAAKANLDMMADQSNGFKSQFVYECIDHVDVVDDYTVKVTLKYVSAPFLNTLAIQSAAMMSPTLIEQGKQAMATTPIGTGQYVLNERKVGEYVKLDLNRDWWGYDADICGGTPILEKDYGFNSITIRPVSEESTRVALLQSGEADLAISLTPNNKKMLEESGYGVVTKQGASMSYFYLNCQKDVFKDIRVRQAISMAIDIDALNEVVYGNEYTRAESPLTSSMKFFEKQEPIEYNPEKAKKLLEEAGYGDGLTLVCWEENDTTDIQRGEFIQQQLEQIGITLKIYPQEGGFLTDNVNAYSGAPKDTKFDCYIRGYGADTIDADEMIGRFATAQFPPLGGNYSFYSNEEFDKWIDIGGKSIDDEVRQEAYSKAQKIFWDDVPAVSLLSYAYTAAFNEHIDGVDFGCAGGLYLMNAKYVE